MHDVETLGRRIDGLETRMAFQDRTIEELSQTVVEQWKQIDALTRQFARLKDQLLEVESNIGRGTQPEPPPPHY